MRSADDNLVPSDKDLEHLLRKAQKSAANVERDRRNRTDLGQCDWRVIVVWECELRQPSDLKERQRSYFLSLIRTGKAARHSHGSSSGGR